MGAGLSKQQISQRIRTRLQRFARENDGAYSEGAAYGVRNGVKWRKGIKVSVASNGETFGFGQIVIGEGGGARAYPFETLAAALTAYKVDNAEGEAHGVLNGLDGDYALLIGCRNPCNQTWGFRYCIGFNLDAGGFDLFAKDGRKREFRGRQADFLARRLYRLIPHITSRDSFPSLDLKVAQGGALDAFAELFDTPGAAAHWTPSSDWRASTSHYLNPSNLPQLQLEKALQYYTPEP